MSKDKFEQLIEYVINDDEEKASELFHQIVVEKSRTIYEDIMSEEEVDESEELDEAADEEVDDEEIDESEEAVDESIEDIEEIGGDAADDLIDEIEVDETGMSEADDEDDGEMHDEEHDAEDLEDRVADLEDELDELMSEFEALVNDDAEEVDDEMGGDAEMVDDTEELDMAELDENVDLKAAPKPVTSEEGGVNKKSAVAANAGAKGPIGNSVKPVHTGKDGGGKHDAAGAYSNNASDSVGTVGNTPAQGSAKLKPATKPHLAQADGVNTKSTI